MKISTKSRYSLKIMVDIAQNSNGLYVSAKDIAKRQEIPIKYLEQLINKLVNTGYLQSFRGANGGYKLTKDAKDYKIYDILYAVEGEIININFDENNFDITNNFWQNFKQIIDEHLKNTTLLAILEHNRDILNFTI